MPKTASQVIGVASAEEGYLEKKSNAQLDDKTANAGYNNITKYWRDVYPSFQGQAWCDAFVSWAFMATYGATVADDMLCGGLRSFYTPTSARYYQKQGRLDRNCKIGDQIFFSRDGTIDGIYHTGIVKNFDGTWIYTTEGNTSSTSGVVPNGGGVWSKKYLYNSYKDKVFFGHPKYDEETPVAKSKAVSYAVQVNVSTYLNVRTGASTQYPVMKVNGKDFALPNGIVVAIVEELNGWGRINDINGWISLQYTKR